MRVPNKYVRKKYKELLESVYLTVYDKRVPIDVEPPNPYIIISSQTKNESNRNKCDKQWDVTTVIDIYYRQQRGVNASDVLDDLEETISNLIHPTVQTDLDLSPYFKIYNTFTEQSLDIPQETATETLHHRALRYRHILGELFVPEQAVVYYGYFETNPDVYFQSNTPIPLPYSFVTTPDASGYDIPFTSAANGKYLVFAEPLFTGEKNNYLSTVFNYGTFNDQQWESPYLFKGLRYYLTRTDNNYFQTGNETLHIS